MNLNQLTLRGFVIVGQSGAQIPGHATFRYNGYEICFSTLGLDKGGFQNPVVVYGGEDFRTVIRNDIYTVQDAIVYIDNALKTKSVDTKEDNHIKLTEMIITDIWGSGNKYSKIRVTHLITGVTEFEYEDSSQRMSQLINARAFAKKALDSKKITGIRDTVTN